MNRGELRIWTVTARWVFPVEGEPIERGSVTVQGDRIVAVDRPGVRTLDQDFGNAAIIPGLVNAHTHLDLSGLRNQITPTEDFTGWLHAVVRHRRQRSDEQVMADVRAGVAEALAAGTTLVGDISARGMSWPVLAAAPFQATVFYELLGLRKPRAQSAWAGACDWLRRHPGTPTCRPGLSPHAPYSVRASLFRAASALAQARQLPLAIHLTESVAELDLLRERTGPFVPYLEALGVWDPTGLVRDTDEVIRRGAEARRVLFIHGNYLQPSLPIPPHASVVYCPRTHAAFGHPAHPFRALLNAGVRVALGTDSLASNPDLSVLAEVRYLHHHYPDVPGERLLRLTTLSGAEALGWEAETGSLVPGKSADLAVVALPDEEAADPHRLLLAADLPVQSTLCRGEWAYQAPGAQLRLS
jgi:cytosine/adenosine deaminase-related metal-dependent hydrolase